MRDGVVGWPAERQLKALADAGFTGQIYQDKMTRAEKRGRRVSALVEREQLLRYSARQVPEMIIVATIRALALNSGPDLMGALKAAAERQATVRALAEGLEIAPGAGIGVISEAASAWDKGRRQDQTLDGRSKGNEAAAAAAAKRREAGLAIARPLWGRPSEEMPATEIAKRAGLSVGTLYRQLGRRSPLQKQLRRKVARDA